LQRKSKGQRGRCALVTSTRKEAPTTDAEWQALDDEALERLIIERWLHRGLLLAVMMGAAITITYLGIRGVATVQQRITIGVLLAFGLAAGAVAFWMRLADLRIHKELRRRRAKT
jgi:hypothetical protein